MGVARISAAWASVVLVGLALTAPAASPQSCHIFGGQTLGQRSIKIISAKTPGDCCDACTSNDLCAAWTFHSPNEMPTENCYLKDNVKPLVPPRAVDPHNHTMSGLAAGATCVPNAHPVELCSQGYPCPDCGAPVCSCANKGPVRESPFGCLPPHDKLPFCDSSLSVHERVLDLVSRVNDSDKPNLLTARGKGGGGTHMQSIPALGVPAYYWGTNCLHSLNGGQCVVDSKNQTRCPTNFPSGPSFGATFDRDLIKKMANTVGVELRAMLALGDNANNSWSKPSIDCWGPVINLNRDPRWGRNGEGGTEDAYAMGELAKSWTLGFQAPRPSLLNSSVELLQGIITLKHMAVNSLENTAPWTRHSIDANEALGVDPYVLADYYLRPFKSAIRGADARGVMCSYNAVLGKPTCLSPIIRKSRELWGFKGYVTSDSDSVHDAYNAAPPSGNGHAYPQPNPTPEKATALALIDGSCDIDSGDTYNNYLLPALDSKTEGLNISHIDRALYNSFKQRFDLGLFDPKAAYAWPGRDDVGTDESAELSLNASRSSIVLLRNDQGLLPLPKHKRIAVIGPHATAQKVLVQPYPFSPFCPDKTLSCIKSPVDAISEINDGPAGQSWTRTAPGCDLFNTSTDGFAEALALAKEADYVILGLGIETCGMDPAHNLNPKAHGGKIGTCYQEALTTGYVFPDQYLELEAHDRTTIDLPQVQHDLAKAVLALNKPTVIFLMNAGAVAIDAEAAHRGDAPLAIIEAFYPGLRGGQALAEGLFGEHNAWGRLPYTIYPNKFTDETPMSMHDLRVSPGRTYRYYREPLFAFGTGLSLTNWTLSGTAPSCLSELSTSPADTACTVQITVSNVGKLAGDDVVLAYFKVERSEEEWAARRAGTNGEALAKSGVGPLMTPIKQLFDFSRVRDVAPGESRVLEFELSAAAIAEVDEKTGDLVSEAASYTIVFDDGAGQLVSMPAKVSGKRTVLEQFPQDK